MIILSTSHPNKSAFVETISLDGEKNLKPKYSIPQFQYLFNKIDEVVRLRGIITCDLPNSELNKFNGMIKLNKKYNHFLGLKNFLNKGTTLKITKWAIGVVVYTGMETKIMENSTKKFIHKQSLLERNLNKIILGIFAAQLVIMTITGILNSYTWTAQLVFEHKYLSLKYSDAVSGVLTAISYLLLHNNMLPSSMVMALETTKFTLGLFINWDVNM